ncbi:MAG TPA: peptidoglycan DD-metalloendopeptidase family protein [Flavobacterium sp.]|jgi:murein DD-endopeptidase MepM/ murein hydrolase activator NlpD
MTFKTTILFFIAFGAAKAQGIQGPFGGEYVPHAQNSICLTDPQRQAIHQQLAESRLQLEDQGKLPKRRSQQNPTQVSLGWPVTKNPASPYNSVWSISGHVDHNSGYPFQVQDYNCGTRSYDTSGGYNHQGVDIFTYPFGWYQFENNESWVVAAAPGIIIGKVGNQYDMNCEFNSLDWNAVYVQHVDGSTAWYGHLKMNSLTTKPVGSSVIAGEYLGVIGSSGNSTGPHLHFEIYDAFDQLVDPYAGACNNTGNGTSWWASQKAYYDPKINAVLTHDADPEFSWCPDPETPNLRNSFAVGETVYMYVYLADELAGSVANVTVQRPDNSILYDFEHSLQNMYYSSYYGWYLSPDALSQEGTYTITYNYQGDSVSHNFTYGELNTIDHSQSSFYFYPNPSTTQIKFSMPVKNLQFINMDGKRLLVPHTDMEADISSLPNGVYVVSGIDEEGFNFTKRLVK